MRLAIFLVALLWAPALLAQGARVEALIERQLSAEGRVVEIDGFAGALSAQATLERLRISDDAGLWLELEDAVLDWSRAALLEGRLEVTALTAARLSVLRASLPGPTAPDAQASGFRIPDLPIAIAIDRVAVDRIELGPDLLGQPYAARLSASARLDSAGAAITAEAARIDGQIGTIALSVGFVREASALAIDARIDEGAQGLVATALGLPGAPPVVLEVTGEGPLDAFRADLSLATAGAERVSGRVTLEAEDGGRRFDAVLGGDVRALVTPAHRAFFGPDTRLTAQGVAGTDGALTLSAFDLRTAQLRVQGQGALDASGAPRALDVRLALAGDGPVRLPGSDVRLDAADLTLAFDAAAGPDWRLDGTLAALDAGSVRVADAELAGTGQITPGSDAPLTGTLELRARGVEAPGDPRLTAVIGPEVSLVTGLRLDAQNAFSLQGLRLTSPHLTLAGDLGGTPTDGRVLLESALRADVPDLAPFGGFAGLPLAGALGADLTMSAELPGRAIAVELAGQSRGLDIGQPALTPLLAPQTDLALSLRRDAAGTELERFALTNVALSVAAEGQIDDADGALDLTARLEDAGTFDARLAGPVDLSATLREVQTRAAVTARLEAAFGLDAALTGALRGEAAGLEFEGTFAEVERFAAPLTGRVALDGALTLTGPHPVLRTDLSVAPGMTARLTGPVSGPQAALDFAARLEDLGAIVAALPGPARVDGTLDLTGDAPRLRAAATAQPGLSATVEGALGGTPITLEAQIADLASFVPVLPGPATLSAAVTDPTGVPALAAALTAPRGFTARVSGRPLGEDGRLDLTAEAANLGLFVPQLPGAARLEAALTDPTGAQRFSADLAGPGLSATVTGDPDAIDLRAQLDRIARFAPGLGGGATLEAALRDLRGARQVEADVRTTSGAAARVSGQVPAGAADLRVTGNVPLALATPFVGDRALSGSTDLDLALRGPLSLSGLSGAVRITGGRLFDPGVGLTVEALSAQVDIAGGAAQLSASGTANEGTLRLGGRVGLTAPFETDLDVQAAGLVYRIAGLLRSRIDAQIALRGAASTRLAATGDIALSETEIRVPDTGLGGATAIPDITHIGAPPGVQRTRARAGLSGRNSGGAGDGGIAVPLDIRITARQSIFLRGRGLDAAFGGALRLGGTAARPEPVGQFSLERGRLDFLGRRLNLTEGRVLLTGVQVPEIQVVAQSLLDAITAQVTVSGPADALEVSVSSTPPLPEDEVLARLLFGRSFDTLSPFQLAQLVASIHTLAGKGSSLTGNARRVFGVDDFDARTDEVTGETELSFGQRINEDIYSEVEVGTQGDVQLNLNLDIGRNTRLRGSASNTGNAGIGIFWDRDY